MTASSPSRENAQMSVKVFYEDAHIAVVEKPAGVIVHQGSRGLLERTFLDDLREYFGRNDAGTSGTRLVHRLDRGTSGLMIVARSAEAAKGMSQAFRDRTVHKGYVALVFGQAPASFTVDVRLGPVLRPPRRWGVDESTGVPARTDFNCVWSSEHFSLLKVAPISGRTHQIRVHSEWKGHPIVGDSWYGRDFVPITPWQKYLHERARHLCLHAFYIEFQHPIFGAALRFWCPLPEAFVEVLRSVSSRAVEVCLTEDHAEGLRYTHDLRGADGRLR